MKTFLVKTLTYLRPDARSRRIAEAQLRESGTRMRLILASVMCLALSLGTVYLTELALAPVPWQLLYDETPSLYALFDMLYYALEIAALVLIALPLLFGTARVFAATSRGERPSLSEMFSPFNSGRSYLRAVLVMLSLAIPRLVAILLIRALWLAAEGRATLIRLLLYALAVTVFFAVSFLLTLDDAVLPLALGDESLSLRALWRRSTRIRIDGMMERLRFKLGYLGYFVLSVLSLGTLLICHTLPLYALAHAAYTQGAATVEPTNTETSIAPTGKTR